MNGHLHTYLGTWYREADLDPTADKVEKRRDAIEQFASERREIEARALDLVRVFYGLSPVDESFVEDFGTLFVESDPSFSMRENSWELQVLAGATIAHLIEQGPPGFGDMLSLAVVCGECQGLRGKVPIYDLLQIALDRLLSRSGSRPTSTSYPNIRMHDADWDPRISEMTNAFQLDSILELEEPVTAGFEQLVSSLNSLYEATSKATDWLSEVLQVQQEEVNILWWLFGGFSRDLDRSFAELELRAACLVAGKELADLVMVLPGPLAADAFLSRMLSTVECDPAAEVSIKDAVNGVPRKWRERLLAGDGLRSSECLLPIHLAVLKSLETDGEADWIPAFEKASKLEGEGRISLEKLSLQMYRERVFSRSVASVD